MTMPAVPTVRASRMGEAYRTVILGVTHVPSDEEVLNAVLRHRVEDPGQPYTRRPFTVAGRTQIMFRQLPPEG